MMDRSNMTNIYLYKYNKYKVLSNQNPSKQIYNMKMNYYKNNLNGDIGSEISGGGKIKDAIRKNICQESGRLRLFAYIASLKTGKIIVPYKTSQDIYENKIIMEDYTNENYKEKIKLDLEDNINSNTIKGCINNKINFEETNNNNSWDENKWKTIDGKSGIHFKGKTMLDYLLDDTFCTGVTGDVRIFLMNQFKKLGAKFNCTI